MWEIITKVIGAWIALAAGFATSGGFIAFISLVGIIPRLAAITKTASHIPHYENCLSTGLILMNLLSLYSVDLTWIPEGLAVALAVTGGLFTGIFVGCLAGALAELLSTIPIFSRRIRLRKGFPVFVKAVALGKCIGSLAQFYLFALL